MFGPSTTNREKVAARLDELACLPNTFHQFVEQFVLHLYSSFTIFFRIFNWLGVKSSCSDFEYISNMKI